MVYETKKTFEIYEISSIRNVVNTLFSTDDIFYTQQRNFKTLIVGGGGTTIHPSTPTPLLLPLVKKIGITSHGISQNTAEFCIDLHRKISYNFAKFGSFSKGIQNKKNIQNIRNFEYTKCRKHPTTRKLWPGTLVDPCFLSGSHIQKKEATDRQPAYTYLECS
jgi:hypothetical protein